MPNPRFLVDKPLIKPGEYTLNHQESHHAVNVMRMRTGDAALVFDGQGHYAEAIISGGNARDGITVSVDGVHEEAHLPLTLTIATAIPKGKRWQLLVEKCTELGVDRIIPILSKRSVAKGEGDIGKWRRWVVEAAKQSRRFRLPEILEPMPIADVPALAREGRALLLVADPQGESPNKYRDILDHVVETIVVIGPEGGFSEAESEALVGRGAQTIRLSPFTLRVETAAAAVCAIFREVLM